MIRIATIAAIGLSVLAAASPALAQQTDLSGEWRCQMAARPHNGDPLSTFQFSYIMMLYPDGTYALEGQFFSPSIGYPEVAQGQGQWRVGTGLQGEPVLETYGLFAREGVGAMEVNETLPITGPNLMSRNRNDQQMRSSAICER